MVVLNIEMIVDAFISVFSSIACGIIYHDDTKLEKTLTI